MNHELDYNERKEWAKDKYIYLDKTIDEIAAALGVKKATLLDWIEEERWDEMRSSLTISKNRQLKRYFDFLDLLDNPKKIAESAITQDKLDVIGKITSAINDLENEDSVCNIIEAALQFTDWLLVRDVDFSRKVTVHFDAFIKEKLAA